MERIDRIIEILVRPKVALFWGAGIVIIFLLSLFDAEFMLIVGKPDNVPIVGMFFLAIFFGWVALYEAVENDKKKAAGKWPEVVEKQKEKVNAWPYFLMPVLISTLLCTVFVCIWSILLNAPLEEPANPNKTMNPSKAPWYFLGLQEVLVYFDPWIAGVVVPTLIHIGLICIPYLDPHPGGGYYTFKERRLVILHYFFGWFILWVILIIVGVFLRGPGWNFFSPYEPWDIHKVVSMTNVDFFEILGISPKTHWILRELPAMLLIGLYFFGIPYLVDRLWPKLRQELGGIKFGITMALLLLMYAIPIKMILRWTIDLKYFLVTPWFNI